MSFPSLSGSEQSSQVGSLSPALTEDTMFVSQAEMGKDG